MKASSAEGGEAEPETRKDGDDSNGGWSLRGEPTRTSRFFDGKQGETSSAPVDETDLMIALRQAAGEIGEAGQARRGFIRTTAAKLGYRRTPTPVVNAIDQGLETATERGIVCIEDGCVCPDCRHIRDYPRDLLKQTLLSTMGRAWWKREDAIRAAARGLGFARTGKQIRSAFNSAISGLRRQQKLERDGDWIRRG